MFGPRRRVRCRHRPLHLRDEQPVAARASAARTSSPDAWSSRSEVVRTGCAVAPTDRREQVPTTRTAVAAQPRSGPTECGQGVRPHDDGPPTSAPVAIWMAAQARPRRTRGTLPGPDGPRQSTTRASSPRRLPRVPRGLWSSSPVAAFTAPQLLNWTASPRPRDALDTPALSQRTQVPLSPVGRSCGWDPPCPYRPSERCRRRRAHA